MIFSHFEVRLGRVCLLVIVGALFSSANGDTTWDVLVFSQQWPATTCMEWKEKLPQHTCSLPPIRNIWTVHGIWPSKFHSSGPFFCHTTLHFNVSELQGIEPELLKYWTNIENGTNTHMFWKHEWKKHGTCAASLPFLNTELKYFQQALAWVKEYNMADVLGKAGVTPNAQGYLGKDVWAAIKNTLGVDSMVHCVTDQDGEPYLAELRICFNKTLELTNCDGIPGSVAQTNCPGDKPALYPGPPTQNYGLALPKAEAEVEAKPKSAPFRAPWLLGVLRGIQLLQWMTL